MITKHFKKLILFALVFRIIFAFIVWHPDLNNHVDWGIRFFEYGAANFYSPDANVWSYTWPNQPPGTILIFAATRTIFENLFAFLWFLNINIGIFPSIIVSYSEDHLYQALLQLPSIMADFGIAYLIYQIVSKIKKSQTAKKLALVFLYNPVIWYNSSVWGQTDSIINFLALLSFYLLFNKKFKLSILAFALSIYIKISLLIFAPIWLLVLLKKSNIKNILRDAIPAFGLILLLTYPFSVGSEQNPITFLATIYQEKVLTQQLQVITANAFNIWAALTGIHEQPHTLPLLGLTYQHWGIILFSIFYIAILYSIYKKSTEKKTYFALALAAFATWSLLTNMHERYLYPVFPMLTIVLSYEKWLEPFYWVLSGLNLLNLYNFWFVPRIEVIVNFLSFGNRLMPRVLGLVNFAIFIKIFHKYKLLYLKNEK